VKLSSQEVAGGRRLREEESPVAGQPASSAVREVATASFVVRGPAAKLVADEAELLADFADFMSGEEELELGLVPTPDPTFKERLRRRLWRVFIMTSIRGGGDTSH